MGAAAPPSCHHALRPMPSLLSSVSTAPADGGGGSSIFPVMVAAPSARRPDGRSRSDPGRHRVSLAAPSSWLSIQAWRLNHPSPSPRTSRNGSNRPPPPQGPELHDGHARHPARCRLPVASEGIAMGLWVWAWGRRGPSGFYGSSTVEEITVGVDANHRHRSNKWHSEEDSQNSSTEGSENDHPSKNTGEWTEGEGEPCRFVECDAFQNNCEDEWIHDQVIKADIYDPLHKHNSTLSNQGCWVFLVFPS